MSRATLSQKQKADQRDEIVKHCRSYFALWSAEAARDKASATGPQGPTLSLYNAAAMYHSYMAHDQFTILEKLGEAKGLICPCATCRRSEEKANPEADACEKVGAA